MILACLIRWAITEAAKAKGLVPGALSFCRALTKTRVFLKKLTSQICNIDWGWAYRCYIKQWGQYLSKLNPAALFQQISKSTERKDADFCESQLDDRDLSFRLQFPLKMNS